MLQRIKVKNQVKIRNHWLEGYLLLKNRGWNQNSYLLFLNRCSDFCSEKLTPSATSLPLNRTHRIIRRASGNLENYTPRSLKHSLDYNDEYLLGSKCFCRSRGLFSMDVKHFSTSSTGYLENRTVNTLEDGDGTICRANGRFDCHQIF